MRRTFFWHLTKTIVKVLEITLLWLADENPKWFKDYLNSAKIKYELSSDNGVFSLDLDVKFVLLFRKLTLFKTRIKVKRLALRKEFDCSSNFFVYLNECNSSSKQYVDSTTTLFRTVLVTVKVGLEHCQKFIPANVMFIKNKFIVTLTLKDTVEWRIGRLVPLTGLKSLLS